MKYDDIIPTHNSLRKPETFRFFAENPEQIRIISSGKPALILKIDGLFYLNDAHHRLVAACAVNYPIELISMNIVEMSMKKMLEVNLDVGWVTPYDPRYFVRRNDCKKYKDEVLDILRQDMQEGLMTIDIASQNMSYTEYRVAKKMSDLIPNEWRMK